MGIDSRRIAQFLMLIVGALVAVSVIGDAVLFAIDEPQAAVTKVVRMFDLDDENNVPAYYSTVLLLAASGLLAIVAYLTGRAGGPQTLYWWLLALLFLGLSFDEYASLHEVLIDRFSEFGGQRVFYFGWVVPGLVFVAIVGAVFLRFVARLEPRFRNLFVASGVVYIVGVLGVELIEGYIASGSGEDNWTYVTALTVQEALEMLGIILFIYSLLEYLKSLSSTLEIRLA